MTNKLGTVTLRNKGAENMGENFTVKNTFIPPHQHIEFDCFTVGQNCVI